MDNYKQLYEKDNEEYKEFYPLTDILSIIDKESGKNLKQLLNQYNHIKLDWKGNTVNTRNSVPLILRHKGLFITYDTGSNIVTEYYTGNDISVSINTIWQNDNNWTNFSVAAGLADQEDITEVNGKFKFADRNHNAAQFTGMGRIILRKNLVDVGGGTVKNVLTQDVINKSNTIYEIRYDFDLNGEKITIPENCVLDFQGGSFDNGTITGNDTTIKAGLCRLFGKNIDIKGNWNIENAFLEWFGAYPDAETDCTKEFQKAINTFKNILISNGTYNVSKLVFLYDSEIKGCVGDCTIITTEGIVIRTHNNFLMEGINVYGNDNTECVIDVYDNFGAKFDRVSIGGGKIGIRFDASEHSYYNNISRSSISGSKIGIMFTHNSNANTVLENRFYQCETCIVIDSCNGNRIMCNTFQDFTLCGIRLEYNNYGSITRANFIAANYFEANQTDNYSDIDFTSNSNCTNNTVIGNNFTYKSGNLHIANNSGENVILDSSGATYSEVFFQLLGGVLKIPTLHSGFTSTYAGDRYKSCLSYIQKDENNTALLASLMDSEGQYWAEVLTKDKKGQVYLPSIQTQEIIQFNGGKINLGVNGSLSERALTFKSGYGIIQYGYSNKWNYLQPMSSGTARPFVAPFSGYCHFDENLNKPIWWNGSKWVDATGADV